VRRHTEVFLAALLNENQTPIIIKQLFNPYPADFSAIFFRQKLALNISSCTFALPNGT
jgi:hypothetical protein